MPEPTVFLNGEYVSFSQAKIPFHDCGIVMGVAFTEMMRTFHHQLFRAPDHLSRLFHSLQTAGMELEESPKVLLSHIEEVTRRNAALIDAEEELGVVIFVTPGSHFLYAQNPGPFAPTICIHTFILPFAAYRPLYLEGASVVIPAVRHLPPECVDATAKHRSRLFWWNATRQARQIEPHSMPLLLDTKGHITETATANFMIARGDTLLIPHPENILHGISLQTVMDIAAEQGMTISCQHLQKEDVLNADEAWLTSTPFCIAPCTRIDGQPIGGGKPGPRWKKVLLSWSERVGKDIYAEITGSR